MCKNTPPRRHRAAGRGCRSDPLLAGARGHDADRPLGAVGVGLAGAAPEHLRRRHGVGAVAQLRRAVGIVQALLAGSALGAAELAAVDVGLDAVLGAIRARALLLGAEVARWRAVRVGTALGISGAGAAVAAAAHAAAVDGGLVLVHDAVGAGGGGVDRGGRALQAVAEPELGVRGLRVGAAHHVHRRTIDLVAILVARPDHGGTPARLGLEADVAADLPIIGAWIAGERIAAGEREARGGDRQQIVRPETLHGGASCLPAL